MHWYAVYVPELRNHLHHRGISLPNAFITSLQKLCNGYVKEGVLQLFLAANTPLQYVPFGVEGRQSPQTVYVRAVMLQKEIFSMQTVQLLDEGISLCMMSIHVRYVIKCNCVVIILPYHSINAAAEEIMPDKSIQNDKKRSLHFLTAVTRNPMT